MPPQYYENPNIHIQKKPANNVLPRVEVVSHNFYSLDICTVPFYTGKAERPYCCTLTEPSVCACD